MEKSNKNTFPVRKKIALELLHRILGHRSTISLLAGDTANVWEDVELRIDPDPFLHIMHVFLLSSHIFYSYLTFLFRRA